VSLSWITRNDTDHFHDFFWKKKHAGLKTKKKQSVRFWIDVVLASPIRQREQQGLHFLGVI